MIKEDKIYNAEDALRLRALIEMATDGIITINDRGIMESVNKAACILFGYTAEEMEGQKVNMLMTHPDRTDHDQYMSRYQKTGEKRIIGIGREVIGRRKDASTFPLRLAVSEVKLTDRTIYTGILHDISELVSSREKVMSMNRELEKKVAERTETLNLTLQRMQSTNRALETEMQSRIEAEASLREHEAELEAALLKERELNQLKSRFVSMASHEFKTPLSTVLSSVELIEMYRTEAQQAKRDKHIGRIKSSISHLTHILNEFLSLGKLEQGRIEVNRSEVSLEEVIQSAITSSQGQLKSGQHFAIQLDGVPTTIYTDGKLLKSALVNILSNAAKYSPADSLIEIVAKLATGERLSISVKDHGIGIPAADQAYLFSRFFRANNVENIKGTGLGLNIVKQYIDLLGGEVTFESTLNVGSTFTMLIPYQLT
ncbi:MAG: PAS domain-containing sensor histidine kinase [Bacteroidota bacterium]